MTGMTNVGAWPVEATSDVGWLRISIGDDAGTQINPPAGTTATFTHFSDAALQTIIDLYPDNRAMQIGTAYQRMGMALASTVQRVRVDDIEIDTRSQADSYFALAEQWFVQARSYGASDAFTIVPTGAQPHVRPEGTPFPMI